MAKKFNNGQTFGEIRQILNDNADEINANATVASDAKTTAEQLAGNNTAGRVVSTSLSTSNPSVIPGNISFNQGRGITTVKKLNTGVRLTDFIESAVDVLWFLKGVYLGAWKTGTLNGIAFLGPNGIVAFDYDTCEMWIYGASRKWQKAGGADYTLPVATADTLGGIKPSSTVAVAADGVASIPENVKLTGNPAAPDLTITPDFGQNIYDRNELVNAEAIIRGFPFGTANKIAVGEFAYLGFSNPGAPAYLALYGPAYMCAKRMDVIVKSVSNVLRLPIVLFNTSNAEIHKELIFSGLEQGLTYLVNLIIFNTDSASRNYEIYATIQSGMSAN